MTKPERGHVRPISAERVVVNACQTTDRRDGNQPHNRYENIERYTIIGSKFSSPAARQGTNEPMIGVAHEIS